MRRPPLPQDGWLLTEMSCAAPIDSMAELQLRAIHPKGWTIGATVYYPDAAAVAHIGLVIKEWLMTGDAFRREDLEGWIALSGSQLEYRTAEREPLRIPTIQRGVTYSLPADDDGDYDDRDPDFCDGCGRRLVF